MVPVMLGHTSIAAARRLTDRVLANFPRHLIQLRVYCMTVSLSTADGDDFMVEMVIA